MAKVLFDLLKALLNATLLLLALCLFLGWQLSSSVAQVSERLNDISSNLRPLHRQAQALTEEFASLSAEISRADPPDSSEMRIGLAQLEEELAALKLEIQSLKQLPGEVVSIAIETAVQELSEKISRWLPLRGDQADESQSDKN
ncbi:hypothetical protein [Pseudophaeobacter flagellatus]|uniref:hypothetical protein n=1 Tax=Pseudophaeobacter flagellatus TaxID=2899119 RepID=UPI001E4FEF39|nr:hypothetical protein [Pseudophaeobacter flagellatus]MCD9147717.1 hypothetical protein [Pseudophaeobacter flagellatus]